MILNNLLAYIDPGTGSMLFTIILGVVTTGIFLVRGLVIKAKYRLSGGNYKEVNKNKIPFIVFSDSKRYWNIFKPICDEFEQRGIECTYFTASEDDPALTEKYDKVKCEFIGEGNKAFAKLNMMSANICLSTTPGLDVLQWKRSKDVDYYVHTFHAVDDGTGYRMFGLDYYDAVLLNGKHQEKPIREIENMRGLKEKETELVGAVQLDEMAKRCEKIILAKKNRTILCAPSWGKSGILSKYGEAFIQSLINTGYDIVVRPHPQSKTAEAELLKCLEQKFPNNEHFQWNYDNDNFVVLSKADILISDFSGVMFEYSFIFNKPIIYADTEFDKAPYDAAWFNGLPWTFNILDKLGRPLVSNEFDRMKEIIDEVIESEKYRQSRNEVINTAWCCRGKAAKNTVDYLVRKREELVRQETSCC